MSTPSSTGWPSKGRLNPDKLNRFKALVSGSTSKAGFADAEFVIEAVFEEMGVKKQVFAECEAVVSDLRPGDQHLQPVDLADGGRPRPPRASRGLPLLQPRRRHAVAGDHPRLDHDPATLATAFAVGAKLKKTCILVKDSPSFIVNRLLGRFMGEVGRVADEGTPVEVTADQAFMGFAPMPPFVLLGLVGPAIALHNGETLIKAFPDRFYVSEGLKAIVEAKKPGFYTFAGGKPALDPEVLALLPQPENPVVLTAPEVRERVLGALAQEARMMLDEGVAQAPMDIDLAMITGAGFQFWNGGLTPLLDRSGVAEQVAGARFLPAGAASVPA
jgi:3-hydroxyacyl-CoA dehydrogenase